MMLKIERDQLAAQLVSVNHLLASLPANDYAGRLGFEHRKEWLEQELAKLQDITENRAQIALYFGGDPVIGSAGIQAEFGANAVSSFQDLLSKVWGSLESGNLQQMGPIRNKEASQLHVVGTVHGSFGFLLEEIDEYQPMFQTALSQAADQATELISVFSGENDNSFEQIIRTMNPRVFHALRGFFGCLHREHATLRIVEGERDEQYDKNSVERAWMR